MSTLFESNTNQTNVQQARYLAQTFTPSISHILTSLKLRLRLYNPAGGMGPLVITIRDVDEDGAPGDTILATTSLAVSELVEGLDTTVSLVFDETPTLIADTAYAIVVYNPDWADWPLPHAQPNTRKWAYWVGANFNKYANGVGYNKDEEADPWGPAYLLGSVDLYMDFWFEEYGDSTGDPVPTPVITQDVSRPQAYDEDLVHDEDTGTWVTDETIIQKAGGRYRTMLVIVCNYQIFFEEMD